MSLIHEALQKAEAERRTGELPPLLSVAVAKPRPRKPLLPMLGVGAAVTLLAAAVLSNRELLLESVGLSPQSEDADISPAAPAATARKNPGAATTPSDLPTRTETARKPAAIRATTPQVESAGDAPIADAALREAGLTPAEPESVALSPAPEPVKADPLPNPPQMKPEAAVADPVASVDVSPPPVAPTENTMQQASDVMSPASVPVPVTPQPETVTESTDATAPSMPYMFELPLATRQSLPALKVTMHVYNADVGKRFAIIDGKRVGEGGVLGQELNLIEIRRDAIVIEHRGTRFLLPRLGR